METLLLIIHVNFHVSDHLNKSVIRSTVPGNQEVLVFEEQRLGDDILVALQPVQPALIDDVPHDHVRVLRRGQKTYDPSDSFAQSKSRQSAM